MSYPGNLWPFNSRVGRKKSQTGHGTRRTGAKACESFLAEQEKMAAGSVTNERSVTTPHVSHLLLRLIEFFHPVPVFQNLARLGAVRGANDAVFLHEIDQTGGAAVADA